MFFKSHKLKIITLLSSVFFMSAGFFIQGQELTDKKNNGNIFTAEDINRMNVSSITDVLEMVPGVIHCR